VICPCQTNWRAGEYHISDCPEAKKLRDSWCTPADVAELLPEVDLDPATNIRSKVKAKRQIVWTHSPSVDDQSYFKGRNDIRRFEQGDGLSIPWNGSIFLNGPYSDMLPWCEKANEEWRSGRLKEAIFLVKLDPTTKWWAQLVNNDTGNGYQRRLNLWLPRKRLQHVPPPRIKASTNNFASAIIHWARNIRSITTLKLQSIADLWT